MSMELIFQSVQDQQAMYEAEQEFYEMFYGTKEEREAEKRKAMDNAFKEVKKDMKLSLEKLNYTDKLDNILHWADKIIIQKDNTYYDQTTDEEKERFKMFLILNNKTLSDSEVDY